MFCFFVCLLLLLSSSLSWLLCQAYGGGIGLVENCFFYIAPGANVQFSGNTACKGPAAYINPGVQQGIGVVGDRHSVCSLLLADDVTLLTLNSSNISALVCDEICY